ncbi:MAG: hypothetical protein IPL75_15620 [Acidobacteria bacterium]|nr:hypothetical protein [Acidobacteriota bacterium]
MTSRLILSVLILGTMIVEPAALSAQNAAAAAAQLQNASPRAIRRDVPLTNAIRRAIDAGTRDLTGRPGSNYWQLETDFTIEARLDPATPDHPRHRDHRHSQQQCGAVERVGHAA